MRWLSLFLACQHLSSGTNLRECEEQSWFKVQAVPVVRFEWYKIFCLRPKMSFSTPGVLEPQVEDHYFTTVIVFMTFCAPRLWFSGQSSWPQNGEVLCFLWGTNWIYICYVEESRPPLWSNCQSSWLQNGEVLCFLWGTNWIYICYVEESRPPVV
jgi:hypothetical protein